MIRNYKVDNTVFKAFPQRFSVFLVANRRTALELSGTGRNFFGIEKQVMETRFDRQWQSFRFGLFDYGKRIRG
jgi:hypothetical protein